MLELRPKGGSVEESTIVRIFDIPGLLTPYFTGRDVLLNRLHDILKPPTRCGTSNDDRASFKRAALFGMPGAGKTQLALKYASQYREQYSAIFFVSAARLSTLNNGYERIVSLLDLPERSRTDPGVKVAAARTWFENSRSSDGRDWLLIVDNINPDIVHDDTTNTDDKNATVVDLVRNFLPRNGTKPHGSIILTTRKPRAAEIVVGGDANLCIRAGEMDEKEAVDLLQSASGKLDGGDKAQSIAKVLGYLPLAINQAATYLKVEDIEFEQFLEDFLKEKDEVPLRPPFHSRPTYRDRYTLFPWNFLTSFRSSTGLKMIIPSKAPRPQTSTGWLSKDWSKNHLFPPTYFASSHF